MADFSPENSTTRIAPRANNRLNRPGGPPPPDRSYPAGYADTPVVRRDFLSKILKRTAGAGVIGAAGYALAKTAMNWGADTEDRGDPRDSLVGKPRDKKINDLLKDPNFQPHRTLFSNPRTDGKSIFRTEPIQDEDSRISPEELKKKGIDTTHELSTIDIYGVTYSTDPHRASLGNSNVIDENGNNRGAYGSWQEIVKKDTDGKWKRTGIVVPDIYIDHALDNVKK